MLCLNYIVASLRCVQCQKYATHICGISFPVWLAVFGVCIPKRDTHTHIYIYVLYHTRILYHTRMVRTIRVWYVPYAYGTILCTIRVRYDHTRMVRTIRV